MADGRTGTIVNPNSPFAGTTFQSTRLRPDFTSPIPSPMMALAMLGIHDVPGNPATAGQELAAFPPSTRRRDWSRWVGAAAIALSMLYVWQFAFRGWIPHDEGLLGQSAERVLLGERPHIDFDDPYTGGLSWLHGMTFRILGARLSSLRIGLFACFALTLPFLYALARRLASPFAAGLVVLTCTVASVPNYFAALPSWYNLFLAIVALWCLVRFDETSRHRWLAAAGFTIGLSFLVKVVALFAVAASLLYLAFRALPTTEATPEPDRQGSKRFSNGVMLAYLTLLAAAIGVAPLVLVHSSLSIMVAIHFILPGLLLSSIVVVRVFLTRNHPHFSAHARTALRDHVVFASAFGIPIAMFLLPYASTGSLAVWFRGVFVAPAQRVATASMPLPQPASLLGAALVAALFLMAGSRHATSPRSPLFATILILLGILALGGRGPAYAIVWGSLRPLVPLAAGSLALLLLVRNRQASLMRDSRPSDSLLFLLVSFPAFLSLVQFPYSFGIYFCYVAPLVILGWMALGSRGGEIERRHLSFLLFYALFAVLWLNRGTVRTMGAYYARIPNDVLLPGRANLHVPRPDAMMYGKVLALLDEHAEPGRNIWAGPDAPEIYFLSGRPNPTRAFYEGLSLPSPSSDILGEVDRSSPGVVVLNTRPEFTRFEKGLYSEVRSRYPAGRAIGRFHVRWKPEPQSSDSSRPHSSTERGKVRSLKRNSPRS